MRLMFIKSWRCMVCGATWEGLVFVDYLQTMIEHEQTRCVLAKTERVPGERVPAEVWPPAQFILDEMEHRCWTPIDLKRKSGLTLEQVQGMLFGSEVVTEDVAQGLSRAFGTGPMVWLRLQASFDTSLAHELGPGELVESARDQQAGREEEASGEDS